MLEWKYAQGLSVAEIAAQLGTSIKAAALLDRDYRSDAECAAIEKDAAKFCQLAKIHKRKEVENFLLIPRALDRAIEQTGITDLLDRNIGAPGDAIDDCLDFLSLCSQYVEVIAIQQTMIKPSRLHALDRFRLYLGIDGA